jgi:hypothetical protein
MSLKIYQGKKEYLNELYSRRLLQHSSNLRLMIEKPICRAADRRQNTDTGIDRCGNGENELSNEPSSSKKLGE